MRRMNAHQAQRPASFGRRNHARPVVSTHRSGTMATASHRPANVTFEARHAVRLNFVAVGLLLGGGVTIRDLLDPSSNGVFGVALSDYTQILAWVLAGVVMFVGLYWIYKSLAQSPAIRMTTTGITGYTFYGVKSVNWPDVERVKTTKDEHYGVVLEVYAKSDSPLNFIFKKGFAMPIGLTDSSLEEIAAAIRVHRPDLTIV